MIQFIKYEKEHGRETSIECDNETIQDIVDKAFISPYDFSNEERPNIITECTACKQKGCITKYLCHTASLENAKSIISMGKLLSAVRSRRRSKEELSMEKRNAAKDPEDFFDYIMFSWGNCQGGDRLVMERKLGRNPTEEDLSIHFTPGIRFYYTYDALSKNKNAIQDGYHSLKIKDELVIDNNILAIIIPKCYKTEFENVIPDYLKDKTHYIVNDCVDIWEWSDKIYNFICTL